MGIYSLGHRCNDHLKGQEVATGEEYIWPGLSAKAAQRHSWELHYKDRVALFDELMKA